MAIGKSSKPLREKSGKIIGRKRKGGGKEG